jgi:hypothetical protein
MKFYIHILQAQIPDVQDASERLFWEVRYIFCARPDAKEK